MVEGGGIYVVISRLQASPYSDIYRANSFVSMEHPFSAIGILNQWPLPFEGPAIFPLRSALEAQIQRFTS